MEKYFYHTLKILKSLSVRPVRTFNWIREDLKKDLDSKNYKSPYKLVWCAGLPKSGSTLVEKIFDHLPYVRLNSSFNRIYFDKNLDQDHGISELIFSNIPKEKYNFLKTHTHYEDKYEKIALRHNSRIIISLRDIRDMLISRYYHILSFKNHWLHQDLKNLNFTEGFILSFTAKENKSSPSVLKYYYDWINDWIKIGKQKNYLVLWYEQYNLDPIKYIKDILQYVDFSNFSADKIYNKIIFENNKKMTLTMSLAKYGRDKTTFRKGEVGEWQKLFNEEITESFNKNLPGELKNILFQYDQL